MSLRVESFFDADTFSWTHVPWCPATSRAAIIDPVLNYDPHAGGTSTESAAAVVDFVRDNELAVDWIIETHAHADHLTAAQFVKEQLGGIILIGAGICSVQQTFRELFNLGDAFAVDGSQFDRLLSAGETLQLGEFKLEVVATPGHTNDSISLHSGQKIFVGDTLFSPDYGTARCDFPGGDAGTLYRSIRKILSLPEETRIHLCHDYPGSGNEPRAVVSVGEQRKGNIHVHDSVSEESFVELRTARDATLAVPHLLLPAVQFNINAGRMPLPESNGISYLKIPLNQL